MMQSWKLPHGILFRPKFSLFSNRTIWLENVASKRCINRENNENLDKESTKKSQSIANGYITVYKFPFIRHVSAFSKLKIYQTILTVLGIPVSIILAQEGFVGTEFVLSTAYLGFSICILLFGSGIMCNRLIGFIYYNEKKNCVKVAYVDYWGNRKEKEVLLSDIVPISEMPINYLSHYLYVPFQQYSKKRTLKLNARFGIIMDKEKFNRIFLIDPK